MSAMNGLSRDFQPYRDGQYGDAIREEADARAPVQYTHRNGETTPPEIVGKYDFFGKRGDLHLGARNVELEVVEVLGVLCVMEGIPWGLAHYQGRWWGPKP